MPSVNPLGDDTYSEEETVARRDAALKRAFTTPHKPHEEQTDKLVKHKLVKHKPVEKPE